MSEARPNRYSARRNTPTPAACSTRFPRHIHAARGLAPTSAPRLSLPAQAAPLEGASRPAGPLLQAAGLVKHFRGPDKTLRTAVRGVSFELQPGETLGIVGESGSGKSTVARMVMALEIPDEGEVMLNGSPWTALSEKQRQPLRRDISIVYQDPLSSFDPRWTVRAHHRGQR